MQSLIKGLRFLVLLALLWVVFTSPKGANMGWIWFVIAVFAVAFFRGSAGKTAHRPSAQASAEGVCPECRSKGAKSGWGKVKCPNPECPRYDASLALAGSLGSPAPAHPLPSFQGSFDPGMDAVRVQYKNFQGEDRTFTGDAKSVWRGKNCFSLRVAPTGQRIRLLRKFVKNTAELERLASTGPMPAGEGPKGVERQVLSYHIHRGSTSPRFEELRKKYPEWAPR